MRIRIRPLLILASVLILIAFLIGMPPGISGGQDHAFRDSPWMPRNLFSVFVIRTGHAPGGGHVSGYDSLGGRARAETDVRWLRVTEVYPPSNPGLYMEVRRAQGYAHAALDQFGLAAESMLEAARHPNRIGFFGGSFSTRDWQHAVYFTYEARGLEAALGVWREGQDALRVNEETYLSAAIEAGDVLVVDDIVVTGEPPPWWNRELDHFEDRFLAETRTVLVERLLDDADLVAARELIGMMRADGISGWPLTLARIRETSMAPELSEQSEELADLTAPLLDLWAVSGRTGETEEALERVLRLHDSLGRCADVRQAVDRLVTASLSVAEEMASNPALPRAFYWYKAGEACQLASLAADDRAAPVCQRYQDLWLEEAGAFQAGAFDPSGGLPATGPLPRPEALACYRIAAP
jgi:hypothetical protein